MNMKSVVIAFGVLSAATLGQAVELANPAVRICFADAQDGYSVTGIVNRLVGGVHFVRPNPSEDVPDFWQIELVSTNKAGEISRRWVSNRWPALSRRVDAVQDGLRFVFDGVRIEEGDNGLHVECEVTLPSDAAESQWRIRVTSTSPKWGLSYIIYPTLRHVTRNGEGDFFEPNCDMGWLWRKKYNGTGVRAKAAYSASFYPTATAYTIGEAGLLFAPHNQGGEATQVQWEGEQNVACHTLPRGSGCSCREADIGFPVSIGVFKGGWLTGAKLYRNWATNAVWCAKGPKVSRADYPKELAELALWLRVSGDGLVVSNDLLQALQNWPGLKVGVHWYNWQNSAHDTGYPEYFPAKKRVKETIDFGIRAGYLMMPYQNLRLWDDGLVSYRIYAKDGVCRHEDGALCRETYSSSGRWFGVMCPGSEIWRAAAADFVGRAVTEIDANSLYLDQLGNCREEPCFDVRHDHQTGGGTWWRDHYVKLLNRQRSRFPGVPLTTEGTGEVWLDVIDGFLLAVPPPADVVPFYAAVYSDYATYFGSPLNSRAELASFRALEARQFIWGVQPGWMFSWQLFGQGKKAYGEWMRVLGEARVRAKDVFAYGEFLGELTTDGVPVRHYAWPKNENPRCEGVFESDLPSVLGSWWRRSDDSITLVLVNHTEDDVAVQFRDLQSEEVQSLVVGALSVVIMESVTSR